MRILSLLLTLSLASTAFAHGVDELDKHRMIDGGIFDYLILGAKHMVTGYDHLLFLFGVIFFLTKFKDIVKFITAFTIGHSITLIFATFLGITANEYLVDAVIALTVIYKGFDNIDGFRRYLKMNPPNLLALVLVFGLIHGFGLSTRLQQLPLGTEGLLAKIISFNVGVEIGQIIALTVMAALLAGWRKTNSFARFSYGANVALMIAGATLFVFQIINFTKDEHHAGETHAEESHLSHEVEEELLYDDGIIEETDAPEHTHDHGHSHGGGETHSH